MITKGIYSSNYSSEQPWKHDVFLSFGGGEEGSNIGNFTDHLYKALKEKGIKTFRGDGSGSASHLKEVEESRFAIVVVSKLENINNIAATNSSGWVEEVVKIVECMKEQRLSVVPVVYHNINHGSGQLANDFRDQVSPHSIKEKEKDAFTQLANLSMWHLQGRPELGLIKDIVKDILEKLNVTCPRNDDKLLVGMASRMEKMDSLLKMGLNDVAIIGISGMQGIGKTTIAHQVFERIKHRFDATAFIANVKEERKRNGILHLKKRLYKESLKIQGHIRYDDPAGMLNLLKRRLHSKSVLIVLDDVDSPMQIEDLIGTWRVPHQWLGPGSRVIVTSANELLLNKFENKYICRVDKLTHDESLQLLCFRAFEENYIKDDRYTDMCNILVELAKGKPSALVNLGNFLRGRSLEEWSDKIAMLMEDEDECR